MTRAAKAVLNSATRFIYEIAGIICSFILPRMILSAYGSEINGLVLSITRFLNISTFIDAAIGSVTRAALYRPLAERDNDAISRVYVSADRFYKKLSLIFAAYTLFIACFLPVINSSGIGYKDIFFLTIAISLSTFIQFMVGATNSVLIFADQKIYLTTIVNTVTLILNTVSAALLIKFGFGIHAVKLSTSVFFAVRPVFAYFYCRSHYSINKKIKYDADPIPDKWSGFSHQIAQTVHDNVDVIVLTVLSVYSNVSIYSVYTLITDGLTKLIECVRSGMGPSFGNMLVTEKKEDVRRSFSLFEWVINVICCIVFTSALILIVPFIIIYTRGVHDADYDQKLFAVLIVISTMLHNMKHPYIMMIYAAGHFKETRVSAYIEMTINIILSVAFVRLWGLNGVAAGTITAMLYRMIYCAVYLSKCIINYPFRNIIIKTAVNLCIMAGAYVSFAGIRTAKPDSLAEWTVSAVIVFVIVSAVTLTVYSVIFRSDVKAFIEFFKNILIKKRNKAGNKD